MDAGFTSPITGFNPVSLFGLKTLLLRPFGGPLAQCRLLTVKRVVDWLTLLEFAVDSVSYSFFRMPLNRGSLLRRFDGLDRFGESRNLPIGSIYQIHACKHRVALTPTRPVWQRQRPRLTSVTLAKPSVRNTTIH